MSGVGCQSALALLAAGSASLGFLRVLFERSAAASSDCRSDWQKKGLGKMSPGLSEATFEKCRSRLRAVHISVHHSQSSV